MNSENYQTIKRQLLSGLELRLSTGLVAGSGREKTLQQQRISRVLRRANLDLAQIARTFHEMWAAEEQEFCVRSETLAFRGGWQMRHLIAVIAKLMGVSDPTLFAENAESLTGVALHVQNAPIE